MKLSNYITIKRFSPLIVVGASLVLTMAAIDFALSFFCDDAYFEYDGRVAWEHVQKVGKRLSGMEAALKAGELDEEKLIVFFGASTVRLGFDAEMLAKQDPLKRKWIVLGAAGVKFARLDPYVHSFINSSVKPKTVIIGIHRATFSHSSQKKLRKVPPKNEGVAYYKYLTIRMLSRHSLLSHYKYVLDSTPINAALFKLRTEIAGTMNHGMNSIFPQEEDLYDYWEWSVVDGEHASAKHMKEQHANYLDFLRQENFGSLQSNPNVQVFKNLVDALREQGCQVVIALMPERSDMREMQKDVVARYWSKVFKEVSGEDPLPVIDYSELIPDEDFFDLIHLNSQGIEALSAKVPLDFNEQY